MFARTRSGIGRHLAWLVVLGLAITSLAAPSASLAASVAPIAINSGNPTCADLAVTYGGGQTWLEAKKDPPGNGTLTVAGFGTITISNFEQSADGEPGSFDWSSTFGIDAVFVKAGTSKHNLYRYAANAGATEKTSDTELESQDGTGNGISHILFCYDAAAQPTTAPTGTPAPTDAPTGSPAPTDAPTGSPAPTDAPTGSPAPTDAPTGGVGGATGTPAGGAGGATSAPTLPTTSTLDQASGPSADGWRIILLALAGLLATALLLTPARAVIRKEDDHR
jgi:hypothetical protein